ncbi:hypothetical protein GCM10027275_11180 [Rhabdobacter roseus]|uniref:Rhodanese-related sulfurtransferase n=1 Tax=Rhabdobacter roseus TaxID=1655419 RepID=A0A840TSR1_9BACT|nr:rhodanese-like domain-containing protein [Rhabdobacter roseus]MBB5283028.1 rhodanese-related sulfurtransferase [Rhabdobacter roseus]
MGIFSGLFGPKINLKELARQGALLVDVRSPQEFAEGHVAGSINIPLGTLASRVAELKAKGQPVITCCRSGARSGMAKSMLEAAGLEAYNGGPWNTLQAKLR